MDRFFELHQGEADRRRDQDVEPGEGDQLGTAFDADLRGHLLGAGRVEIVSSEGSKTSTCLMILSSRSWPEKISVRPSGIDTFVYGVHDRQVKSGVMYALAVHQLGREIALKVEQGDS